MPEKETAGARFTAPRGTRDPREEAGDWEEVLETVGEGAGGTLQVAGSEAEGYGRPHSASLGREAGVEGAQTGHQKVGDEWRQGAPRHEGGELSAAADPGAVGAQPEPAEGPGTLGGEGGGLAESASAGTLGESHHQKAEKP